MIKSVIRSYLISLFALWVTASYIGSFHLANGFKSLLLVGLGFTFLHLLIRPIASLLLGPLNFLTLGLIGLVIDSFLLYGLTLYFPQVNITAWGFTGVEIQGFVIPPFNFSLITGTVLSAAIINVVRSTLSLLMS